MKFKPCRLTYAGQRYDMTADGTVRTTEIIQNAITGKAERIYGNEPVDEALAAKVRADAKRQRANKNRRERHQTYLDLGMKRNRDGSYE